MKEQTVKTIINFLDQLGLEVTSKVEQLVEVSYPIIIKQVYVEVFSEFTFVIFGLLLGYISFKWFKYVNKKIENQTHYDDWGVGHVGTGVGIITSALFIIGGMNGVIIRLINPQWYAAKLIFELIKNGGM
jgi:cbb3-type cytochrome oxidase subunit 1